MQENFIIKGMVRGEVNKKETNILQVAGLLNKDKEFCVGRGKRAENVKKTLT